MNLIPVNVTKNDEQYVSGRDLHMFLEISTPYTMWFNRMCEYGFVENVDYMTDHKKVIRADGKVMPQTQLEHELTIEMAKQLCMLARNDKGREAREYFIEVEKEWNSPEKVMSRALKIANNVINEQWILYKDEMGKGYTKSETFTFTRTDGRLDSKIQTKWTQKGRLRIHEILTAKGIQAVCKEVV